MNPLATNNGWTGGQYSLLRIGLGLWLAIRFALAFAAAPGILSAAGVVASALLMLGWLDRVGALAVLAIFGSSFEGSVTAIVAAWPLLAHLVLPTAPYGSLAARGRTDPRGGWAYPDRLLAGSRWALIGIDAYVAWTVWHGPSLLPLVPPLIISHLLAFDPAWIRAAKPGTTDVVFFDGTCGLCHRGVRWFLAEDRTGTAYLFAPLGGERFAATIPDRAGLPDSLVVRTADGRTLTKFSSAIWLMKRCGGLWRVVGALIGFVPRPIRDAVYDGIARVRYRLFPRPKEACPLLPPDLRARFVP
jgi:predicted DCC family thiol-disulfide oxidoreductase YuxK